MTTQTKQVIEICDTTDRGKAALARLIAYILTRLTANEMRGIILVAGPSCGGKTSMAKKIEAILQVLGVHVARMKMDDYYKDRPPDAGPEYNFDVPDAQDLDRFYTHLGKLMQGEPIQKPVYGFGQFSTYTVEFAPAPVLVVDGLFGLCHKGIRDLATVSLFVTASEDVCLERRLARDTAGRDCQSEGEILRQWNAQVLPGRGQFVDPSARHADFTVLNNSGNGLPCHDAVAELVKTISRGHVDQ